MEAVIAKQNIPVYTTLSEVFGSLEASLPHAERWNNLAEEFEKRFGKKPAYITRAPGRVNLIGEHIDYALFGVLPAAIERDILVACGPRSVTESDAPESHSSGHSPGGVVLENLHSKYNRQVFAPTARCPEKEDQANAHVEGWHLDINTKELRWESYVKAGYYGVLGHYFSARESSPTPVDLLVTGSVPAGSGLSSSAAMVVASTLAFLSVNGKLEASVGDRQILNKGELVQLAMENEKRVGVNSGGMDQAASVMSDPSSALYISFYPSLSASAVPLPSGAVFVCANSLVVSDKALSAKRGYNLRVVETLVAARILSNSLGLEIGLKDRITLREVVGKFSGERCGEDMGPDALEKVLVTLEQRLDILKPNHRSTESGQLGVTIDEMVKMSGLSKTIFHEVFLSWVDVEATYFQLYNRARHVFSEARRVLQFRRASLDTTQSGASDGNPKSIALFERLGQLMNDSQASCALDFECSCPELDVLTKLAVLAGAYGSRLTGAGWGGCTVSLVPEANVNDFIRKIKETYPPYQNLEGDALNEVIFATKPGRGACVLRLET